MTNYELNDCTNLLNTIDIMNSLTFHTNRTKPSEKLQTGIFIKGGPEPLEKEIHEILPSSLL